MIKRVMRRYFILTRANLWITSAAEVRWRIREPTRPSSAPIFLSNQVPGYPKPAVMHREAASAAVAMFKAARERQQGE